ncbi:MAG: rod shape-determining protein MreD [Rikenellaceae bacterium]|nr:rod shape-determining protein MreD [Rikenellaceae bacterium]
MRQIIEYALLFLVLVLLQVFLFSNLELSVYLNPLIYIAFIVLLPIEAAPVVVLGLGLLTGVVMDVAMGAAGLNTLATLPVAFLRGPLLRLTCSKDSVSDGGVPSVYRLGVLGFVRYVVAAVVLHSLVYFTMECATFDYFHLTLLRTLVSGVVTVAVIYFTSKIFNSQVARVL